MLKRHLFRIYRYLRMFGFDPRQAWRTVVGLPWFYRGARQFEAQAEQSPVRFRMAARTPFLEDRASSAGTSTGQYFHQDLLVAQRIFRAKPRRHVDIGSRIDGFVAHVATFREIDVFDIRSLDVVTPNIRFLQADLMAPLDDALRECTDSLSSLHAIEHFGLGRYGDPIRFDGHLVALRNMAAMVEPHGRFYLSTPIGEQRVEFNGQRVFSVGYINDLVLEDFAIDRFSYVGDDGKLHEDQMLDDRAVGDNFGCHDGCGIWELTKR